MLIGADNCGIYHGVFIIGMLPVHVQPGTGSAGTQQGRGGFTSKIHPLVDALGNPLRFRLTGGQRNDITQAGALIEGIENAVVLGDKGYDCDTPL